MIVEPFLSSIGVKLAMAISGLDLTAEEAEKYITAEDLRALILAAAGMEAKDSIL